MSKINPRVDFAFKILFGSEENKDILLSLVNAVLSLENPFTDLTLLNPYRYETHSMDKFSILDIRAQDATEKIYHIEIQMNDLIAYDQRALHHWSKIYSQLLSEGGDFAHFRKTINIHILNFNHLDDPNYHNIYHLLNTNTHRRSSEDLELHFIELKKFNKDPSHLTNALDRWITFLTKAEQWGRNFIPPELKNDPAIEKAAHVLDTLSLDQEELEIYEAQLMWLRDQAAILEKTQKVFIKKGIEMGKEIGKEEVARHLLQNGALSIQEISNITGISEELLHTLK